MKYKLFKYDIFKINNKYLNDLHFSLKWKVKPKYNDSNLDLDIFILLLSNDGKCISKDDVVYYGSTLKVKDKLGRPYSKDNSVLGSVDAVINESKSENVNINLNYISNKISEICLCITISKYPNDYYKDSTTSNLKFSDFENIELGFNNQIISLDNLFNDDDGIEIGRLVKKQNNWEFNAHLQPIENNVYGIINNYLHDEITDKLLLEKAKIESLYFYTENNKLFGPFSKDTILPKIKPESLIFIQGTSDWKNANDISAFKSYFNNNKNEKIINQKNNTNNTSVSYLKIIFILILSFICYLYFTNKDKISKYLNFNENALNQDSVNNKLNSTALSEYEIFTFDKVVSFKATKNQMQFSDSLYNVFQNNLFKKDFINGLSNLKNAIANNPKPNYYYDLAKLYIYTSDFEKSNICISLASKLDYQPNSNLDYLELIISAKNGNYYDAEVYANSLILKSPSILTVIDNDTLLFNFHYTSNYINIIEKNNQPDSLSEIYNIISNYYYTINSNAFDANNFYAPLVLKYIQAENVTPEEINSIWQNNYEFTNQKFKIINNSIYTNGYDEYGNNKYYCWVEFNCYRTSKKTNQACRLKSEFIFNTDNQIVAHSELQIKDIKYYK